MQGSGENKTTYETKRDDMNYKRTIPLFKLLSQKKKKRHILTLSNKSAAPSKLESLFNTSKQKRRQWLDVEANHAFEDCPKTHSNKGSTFFFSPSSARFKIKYDVNPLRNIKCGRETLFTAQTIKSFVKHTNINTHTTHKKSTPQFLPFMHRRTKQKTQAKEKKNATQLSLSLAQATLSTAELVSSISRDSEAGAWEETRNDQTMTNTRRVIHFA